MFLLFLIIHKNEIKMKNFIILITALLSISVITTAFSQGNVSIHVGPAFPLGDFKDEGAGSAFPVGGFIDEEEGSAAIGINAGIQYSYPLSESGIGVFGGVDVNYNGLQDDVKDEIEESFTGIGEDVDITYPKYINIPITAGVNYTADLEKIGLFVELGLAYNFLKITNFEIEVGSENLKLEFNTASNFGFKIGGGILVNDNLSISLNYFALGEHDIDGEADISGGFGSGNINLEREVSLLTINIGYKF